MKVENPVSMEGATTMKKLYEEVELEVVRFGSEDVITASQEDDGGNNGGSYKVTEQSAITPTTGTTP